jgi:selenocysteine lyase/cysteine desulfurase
LAEGADKLGYEILGPPRTPAHSSGILSLRHPQIDSRLVHSRLREYDFLTAPRQGWVRISPHFYISPEDIDKLLAALPRP